MEEKKPKSILVNDFSPIVQHSSKATKKVHGHFKKNPKNLVILLTALLIILLAYGYWHTKNELDKLSNPKTAAQSQTKDVVSKVNKLVELPAGETPTLATVNDASKLKNQAFFADAKDGDKVLIYNTAGRALIYRPSTNKVVAYSRINLNQGQ